MAVLPGIATSGTEDGEDDYQSTTSGQWAWTERKLQPKPKPFKARRNRAFAS